MKKIIGALLAIFLITFSFLSFMAMATNGGATPQESWYSGALPLLAGWSILVFLAWQLQKKIQPEPKWLEWEV